MTQNAHKYFMFVDMLDGLLKMSYCSGRLFTHEQYTVGDMTARWLDMEMLEDEDAPDFYALLSILEL